VHECVYLGSDEWGDWFGQRGGWRSDRPGRSVVVVEDNVTLLPPSGDHVLTMNARPHLTRVYIDIAWDAGWSADGVPSGIDMDLDVVDREGRGVYIDDEDEWEEHRVLYGYPLDIAEKLEAVTAHLAEVVAAEQPPYDRATAERWLARLVDSTGDSPTAD